MEIKAVLMLEPIGISIYMGIIQAVILRPSKGRTLGMPARM